MRLIGSVMCKVACHIMKLGLTRQRGFEGISLKPTLEKHGAWNTDLPLEATRPGSTNLAPILYW